MASEELRKKWGTIFMGEREATVAQLDAMQEPLRREQLKREQQEDYMERVRAKAAERARAILGAAYAERQKVLEEARAEAEAERQQLIREGEALKAAGAVAHGQAAAELAKARAVREEAERIREAAHGEGFQAGMEQAGAELKEFRAELGQSLAVVLRAVDAQRKAISDSWRGELVELVRTAVSAGTGWLLHKEHDAVLRSLVLEAVTLLEDRATVTVRVNPEDEVSACPNSATGSSTATRPCSAAAWWRKAAAAVWTAAVNISGIWWTAFWCIWPCPPVRVRRLPPPPYMNWRRARQKRWRP